MIEVLIQKVIYKLDFIDLNILEEIVKNDYFIAFPTLVRRLEKVNVWNRGIIRRRIKKLRELKLIHFIDSTSPMMLEAYLHKEKTLMIVRDLLKKRLIRY